ncbi:MAG: DUF6630 family protein [Fluviicola sp.]
MNTEKKYFNLLLALTNDEGFSKELAAELIESDTHPSTFFNKHQENHFSNRGITASGNPEQTLCYLLDKLEEHDFLRELDYKADAEELNYAIQQLSKGKIEDDLLSEEDEEDAEGMFELIFDAEDYLEEYDLAIVQFPLDSDSHPIALVSFDRGEEIQTMIDELFDNE